jgi:hypothetical protein
MLSLLFAGSSSLFVFRGAHNDGVQSSCRYQVTRHSFELGFLLW